MATIDLKNTANNPSTFYLGVNDAQNAPIGYESVSSGAAISDALLSFTSIYQSVYEAVASSNWSSGGSGWTVAEVIEVPAGTTRLTMVRFEKLWNGRTHEFSLVGNLTVDSSNKNLFSISGSTLIVDSPYGDAEIKLSAATTMKFEQTNSSKTYETQTSFYSGNINQAPTTVGALPVGAELKSINTNNLLPTSWTQIGSDTNSFALMTLQGTFNFTSSNNSLGGSVTGMKTVNPVDSGPGFQINTYAIANGQLNPASAFTPELGIFNNKTTLALTKQERTEGPIQVNFATLIPDLPPSGVSTATYTSFNQVPMSTEIGKASAVGFSGSDTFNVTSNTDTFIHAGAGNDVVNAGAGNDIIYGGAGNDILNGGAGNDLFLVNQADGGGNSITNASSTANGKVIFSHTIGNNVINGGTGIDTFSFAPQMGDNSTVNQTNIQTISVPKTGPNVFDIHDNNGHVFYISIPGISNEQYYVGTQQVNQYGIAAIELYPRNSLPTSQTPKQIYVIDTQTAEILYHFNLNNNEDLLATWDKTSTSFLTQARDFNVGSNTSSLTLKQYHLEIGNSDSSAITWASHQFNGDITNGRFSDVIQSANGQKSYLSFLSYQNNTAPVIYEIDNFSPTSPRLIASIPLYSNAWIGNSFFHNGDMWFQGSQGADSNWNTQYFSLNITSGQLTYQNNNVFWDAWQEEVNTESFYRIGDTVLDLTQFGDYVEVQGVIQINENQHLLQLGVTPNPNSNFDVDYERWVVIDQNGQIIADKSFNTAAGYNLRHLGDNEVHDGYLYFQQLNANFTLSGTNVTNVTQGNTTAPTVYKVPLFAITSLLSTSATTLGGQLGVQKVQDYAKSAFSYSPSNIVVFQSFVPVTSVTGIYSTSNLVVSVSIDLNSDYRTIKLTQVNSNGTPEYSFDVITGLDADFKDYKINNGKLYLLLNSSNGGQYQETTAVYDPSTHAFPAITQGRDAFNVATQAGEMAIEALAATITPEINPELLLFLPAAYYSSNNTSSVLGNSAYYKSAKSELGELNDSANNGLTQDWTIWQAPADGSIAIGFKNSYTGSIEYSHLKDVEFLELNSPDGSLETYDIRPLYLASSGNDTLYSFSRSGYESINYVFNNSSESSGSGAFDDPIAWYRNQFAVFTRADGGQEWRYYLNGGAGNDTLHGRSAEPVVYGPNDFEIFDVNENAFHVSIPNISNSQYQIRHYDSQVNQQGIAVLGLSPILNNDSFSPISKIYVVDLNTSQVLSNFDIPAGQNFIRGWNSTATNFYTEQRSGNTITIRSYDFGSTSLNHASNSTSNYNTLTADELNGGANDIVKSSSNGKIYLAYDPSNAPGVIYELSNGTATKLTNLPPADWFDHLFIRGNELWFKGNFNYNASTQTWTEAAYSYDLYSHTYQQQDWNFFWATWQQEAATTNYPIPVEDLGRDTLDGGAGADTMIGYGGNDSYFVDDAKDVVVESASSSQGFDTVLTSATYALNGGTGVERLMVHQIMPGVNGNLFTEPRATPPALASATVNLTGNNFTYELIGHDGANTITAGALAGLTKSSENNPTIGAVLLGLGGTDTLIGGERDDHLFGGAGNDKLIGNAGNDSFYMGYLTADTNTINNLLPSDYYLWNNFGFDGSMLSGGDDTATGGDGFDTVVIATDTSGDFSPFYIQRISETQIKIFTVAETMTVDSTVEAIKYQSPTSSSPEIYLLPWASTLDATTRDKHFLSSGFTYPLQYAAPSDYADLIDLNNYFPTQSDEIMSSFDAGKGNDIIYGDGRFSTLRGGDGNDWIFSGFYPYTDDEWRYEMYGDAGNDTLTISTQHMQGYMSNTNGKVLLDGGAGDDNYRVIIDNQNVNIRIEDSAGKDSLTLYALNHSDEFDLDVIWDAGELRVISYTQNGNSVTRNIVAAANADTLENLYFAPYAEEQNWYSTAAIGGNLVKPTTDTYATGKMTGTAGNDVLLALPSVRQNYDGGAGDDVILVGNVNGNIISGGAGNNIINQSTYVDFISTTGPLRNSISYAWATSGTGEINLQSGLGYIVDSSGKLLGSDRWDSGLFTDVIGGGANERIKGSDGGNKLDGGAGNDIIYSGGNQAFGTPDQLIGGTGNDILIDESHWFSQWYWSAYDSNQAYELQNLQSLPGSTMEGGAGNDVYVLQHNGTIPSTFPIISSNATSFPVAVTPTRIIERDTSGKDTGGSDTIRFVTSGDGLKPYKFAQKGNLVQIQLDTADIRVGDILMVSFLSGTTASNAYTIEKVTLGTGADAGTSIVEFTALTSATLNGNVLVDQLGGFSPVVDWVDSNTLAVFSSGDISSHVLNAVANGAPTIQSYNSSTGQVVSNMPVQALIDKNAMEFFDFGSADPEQAGFVVPVSYNIGKSSSVELIISGGPGQATLFGGEGTDLIVDTPYDDVLIGGNGNDIISSQIGFDIVDAGAGNDTISFRSDNQILIGGQGADQFIISGVGNSRGGLIADFKPWEGDVIKFNFDWLENFMDGESRPFGTPYSDVTFNIDYNSLGLDSSELVITAQFTPATGTTNDTIDILRIQYNSDQDKVDEQIGLAMEQLIASAHDNVYDTPRWTINDADHMT